MADVETIAIISDVHWPHTHVPTWRAFRAWHRDVRPTRTVVLGDGLDLPMVSKHPPEPEHGSRVLEPAKTWTKELNELAEETRDPLEVVEGNHDVRLKKRILEGLEFQLHGLEELYGIEAVCRHHGLSQAVLWHREDCSKPHAPITVGQFGLRHGHLQGGGGRTPAATLMHKDAGVSNHSLIRGHFHRPQIYTAGDRTFIVNAHMEAPVRFTGGVDNWTRGWTVLHLDVERGWAQAVPMWSNTARFYYEGRFYDGNAEGPVAAQERPQEPPELEAPSPVEGVRLEVFRTASGRQRTIIWWPDDEGHVCRQDTGEVGRRVGLSSATIQARLEAWERRYGKVRTEMTQGQLEAELLRPLA